MDRVSRTTSPLATLKAGLQLSFDPIAIFDSHQAVRSHIPIRNNQSRCTTCPSRSGINRACIGLGDHVPKWGIPELKYVVSTETFRSPDEAVYTAAQFAAAVGSWGNGIGVTFRQVQRKERAHFNISYSDKPADDADDVLASALLPNDGPPEHRTVHIHALAFAEEHINNQVGILAHEIGHILGLRHGFANTTPDEILIWSIQFGKRDKKSVMEYFEDTSSYRVTDTDRRQVKDFYKTTKKLMRGRAVRAMVPHEHLY